MQDIPNQTPKSSRSPVDVEEKRAWVRFYKQVGRDAALATEIMSQLESDNELKRRHLALYLCCKQSIRQQKSRQARDRRIGQWLGAAARAMLISPVAIIVRTAQRSFSWSAEVMSHAGTVSLPGKTTLATAASQPPAGMTDRPIGAVSRRSTEPAKAQVSTLTRDAQFADAQTQFLREAGMSPHAGREHIPESLDGRPTFRAATAGR